MSAPRVVGTRGHIALGPLLGRGGEGAVYEVVGHHGTVAKVYHEPARPERAAKLLAMVSMGTPELFALTAWPTDVLRRPDGTVTGLLMPRIEGHKDIHTLYGPKSRRIEFPNADWRHLVRAAVNTARAFAVLHNAGCVIGDINHGGIRVSPTATVRLIDCDSFQIHSNGHTYLCEVGVENFTPPELQSKSFKGITRTPNHDAFGLAVMVFNLLMMGRHPFAGRYSGRDEMPVERAISQFRYAYGQNRAISLMEPPPHSAPALIASREVATLWERAFSRAGAQPHGRPTAREWVAALSALESSFARCRVNPCHQYLTSYGSCPWCPIENASGTLLFAVPLVGVGVPSGAAFNAEVVWAQITAVASPGPAAEPSAPRVSPSPEASALGRRGAVRKWVGWALLGVFVTAAMYLAPNLWMLWLAAAWGLWSIIRKEWAKAVDTAPFREQKRQAERAYRAAQARWKTEAGPERYLERLRELDTLHKQLLNLAAVRQAQFSQLLRDRERNERKRFLEKFEIADARIPGIGPAKRSMLESYNIETAADIERQAILNVPGVGPALAKRLEDWRRGLEQRFRFDPNAKVDPRDVTDLDRRIITRRHELQKALQDGPAELTRLRATILAQRNVLRQDLERTAAALAQAEANLKAVS